MKDPDLSKYEKIAKFDSTLVENMELLTSMDNYYKWVGKEMRKYCGKKVLDIGCANGNLTSFFLDKELIVAADYSENYLKIIKERFKNKPHFSAIKFDATDVKTAQKLSKYHFDTIVTMNTFEHIKDDFKAIKNSYDLLEKSGRFIIFVPASMWLYSILDYEGGHYRRYTKKDLKNKLEKAGFKVEKIKHFNMAGALGWYINHVLFKKRIYSSNVFKVYNSLVPIFRATESMISPPLGLSLFCVARKI